VKLKNTVLVCNYCCILKVPLYLILHTFSFQHGICLFPMAVIKTAFMSVHVINWLNFVTELYFLYSEEGTEIWNIIRRILLWRLNSSAVWVTECYVPCRIFVLVLVFVLQRLSLAVCNLPLNGSVVWNGALAALWSPASSPRLLVVGFVTPSTLVDTCWNIITSPCTYRRSFTNYEIEYCHCLLPCAFMQITDYY
jgi:hypothetical protein